MKHPAIPETDMDGLVVLASEPEKLTKVEKKRIQAKLAYHFGKLEQMDLAEIDIPKTPPTKAPSTPRPNVIQKCIPVRDDASDAPLNESYSNTENDE